jgi:hypothetical protein
MSRGLPSNVKSNLHKALDSALLAVEAYNKPAVKFKTSGYIVLMCIAWLSLMHAIFYKQGIKPIYKKGRRYKKVNGEIQYWELSTCVQKYFPENSGIRKNIELFIPLRNKIEHKFLPSLDSNLFAECQALLMNFDTIVEKEFGPHYCLRESLSFALQLFPSTKTLNMSVKEAKDAEDIVKFVNAYRESISPDIIATGEYSFKAFLIKVANHKSKEALPIQFVRYDDMTEEEKKEVDKFVGLVKEKSVPVANKDKVKPGAVIKAVQSAIGNPKVTRGKKIIDKFNSDVHARFWKKYNVRPSKGSATPEKTDSRYCVYDEPNESYLYTKEWIDFLIEKMADENEYKSLYNQELDSGEQ